MKALKRFLIFLTMATAPLMTNAQFDTTSTLYDFEMLPNGNLNGTGGWKTTLYNTTVDWRISDTLSGNVGKGIFFNQVGPSVGASASRVFDTLFPNAVFDQTISEYIFQFDLVRNYWGVDIGISADLNNDGKTAKADALEKALIFRSGSLNGESLTVPNGTNYTLGNNLSNAWYSVRITIRPYTGNFGGTVDVEYQPVFAPTWTSLGTGLPLYADSLSTSKTNITRWNTVFIHSEGATGKADELRFTKISPQQTTELINHKPEEFKAYCTGGQLFLNSGSNNLPVAIEVFDSGGKLILEKTCGDCTSIPFTEAATGKYIVRAIYPGKKPHTGTFFVH